MGIHDEFNKLVAQKPEHKRIEPTATPDEEDLGFCASLARNRGLFGLGIKKAGSPDRMVEYFDVEIEADNTYLKLITGSRKVWMLELWGRNLLRLAYKLKEHQCEYVRKSDRDTQVDGELYIEKLEFRDVTEQMKPKEKKEAD